jgi:cell fate regulator YaaT (PSP1 superfamily)
MNEDELKHLEDEMSRASPRSGSRESSVDLPSPLYRIRTMHSNETFFAWFGEEPDSGGLLSGTALPSSASLPDSVPAASRQAQGPAIIESEDFPPIDAEAVLGEDAQSLIVPAPDEEPGITPTMRHFRDKGVLPTGGRVVAPTRYGRDLCEVQGIIRDLGVVIADELVEIDRIATLEDIRRHEANLEKETAAFELCRQKIASRNLAMKLVSAHYLLEEPKVLFYFSAESRVDFRELVKDLVSNFKMRIELRQIGVRDEARVTGGCGVCGRVLCCHGVSDKLTPVSIKMAKDQNLSLNSLKISGPCGRLLCCLAYEYNFYRDARRELPNEGARFAYEGVPFRVIEVNALASKVKMAGEDGRILDMPAARFRYSEGRWHVKDPV